MCRTKEEAKSKIDQLIQSMDRLANALVANALVANAREGANPKYPPQPQR